MSSTITDLSSRWIWPLETLPAEGDWAGLVGRKALSLAELMRQGLPVPQAVAVSTQAYRAVLASAPVATAIAEAAAADAPRRSEAFARVRAALIAADLPEGVEAAIREAYGHLGGGPVAVRSSGAAEDLEGASFAGMYESFLGVQGAEEVVAAVRQCWASAWSDRVVAYAEKKGLPRESLVMGVVIQRLVDAETAGVLFTIDPLTGREDHMRIEACFGLGEALVAGKVQPDCFVMPRRGDRVIEETIAHKAIRLVRGPDGVTEEALGAAAAEAPTLSPTELTELTRLGRCVQAHYGCPQDLEWAIAGGRIFLVQSRPVTTISYAGIAGEWTTADFKDGGVSASVCSPYMWSLYDYVWQASMPGYLRKIQLLKHREPIVWGRVFYGRPYWNVGEVKRCLHNVPGFNERTFDADLGIEGAYEGDGVVVPVNPLTLAKAVPTLLALELDYQTRLLHNQAFVLRFEWMAAHYRVDPDTLDRKTLAKRYRKLLVEDYFETESTYFYTIYNTSNAKLDFKVELDKANATAEAPLSYLHLLSGLQGVKHLDPLKDLWAIAGTVRESAAARALVEATPADALARALEQTHPAVWQQLAAYLRRYRHHSVAELDITQPRWDEDPTFVLQTLKQFVAAYDPERDPSHMGDKQHALYTRERARAEAHFKRQGLAGLAAGAVFWTKLELMRTYAWWREELRDRSSRMYAKIRRETLAVARRLVAEGVLEQCEDIWYLTFRDVLGVLDGKLAAEEARRLIGERREDADGFRRFTNPNELGVRFAMGRKPIAAGALVGIPCSPGVVRARVRVVPTIQDAHTLQPGELLVTKFTDPGWTTLFSQIAGVVTETGGILSHAAVIAREYGIPAVLAIPEATRRLRDGDWVEIDGQNGTVTKLDGGPDGRGGEWVEKTVPQEAPPPPGGTSSTREEGRSASSRTAESAKHPSSLAEEVARRADGEDPDEGPLPRPGRYATHARPELMRLMRALGLEIHYTRAQGDHMTYETPQGPKTVVDLLGGYGANLFGHHHPALVAELTRALSEHVPIQAQASCRAWAGELAAALAERVGAVTGRNYIVTLVNTGTEAIEAALKHAELERHQAALETARRQRRRALSLLDGARGDQTAFLREVSRELGVSGTLSVEAAIEAIAEANRQALAQQPVYFALERAFHGKTSGSVQVTYNADYRTPFARIGVRAEFLPANDPNAWERAIARATVRTWDLDLAGGALQLVERPLVNVSAILIEPIQGEGGIHELSPADARQIRALADAHGIPLVIDEIQSGMGRTGRFLASEALGIRGDYYTLAKSLGGGLTKLGALLIDRERYCDDFGVLHTSTFAEDDLSCRVALKSLALLKDERIPQRAEALGEYFLKALETIVARHPHVLAAVRGRGLMLGLEFRAQAENPSNVIRMLSDHGYLGYVVAGYLLHEEGFRVAPTLASATTIRLEPSAFLPIAEIDGFLHALERLCNILERGNAYRLTRYVVGLAKLNDATPIEDFRRDGRLRREAPRCEKRVAFIGHFIEAKDAVLWDPSLGLLPPGAIESYQLATHRIFGPTIYDQIHVTSAIGETVHMSFIGLNLTSRSIESALRKRKTDWVLRLIEEAVDKARAAGCQVVGLGGFTSIVADNGRKLDGRGVTLTTGNALTVGMGVLAITRGAAESGIPLADAGLAVIGAAGNIGSVYARIMAEDVARLVLVGREGGSRLQRVAEAIYEDAFERLAQAKGGSGVAGAIAGTRTVQRLLALPAADRPSDLGASLREQLEAELGHHAPVIATEEIGAIRNCRLIVCASNAVKPLVYPEHLASGPIVICDISVPADVAPEVAIARPDVRVILGGLVRVPDDPSFRVGGIPLPAGHAFACMSETLLLGLMGAREHFSYGPITPEKVRQALAWASVNGFELGDFKTARSY